jgi:serine phosphatase RsbU (regulator of sigma subunit)
MMGRPLRRLGEILREARTRGGAARIAPPDGAPDDINNVLKAINEATDAAARSERQLVRRDQARREMEQSEQVQRALLPLVLPDIPGYESAASYRTAQRVGGDYYDVIPVAGNSTLWILIVADVAGKGFPAALVMTAVRTAMRLLAPARTSPSEILTALDDYLSAHHAGGPFVTAVCAVLDSRENRLTTASAGHTPILHRRHGSGVISRINPPGRPLGVRVGTDTAPNPLRDETIDLGFGDLVAFYTDGLTESRDPHGSAFGITGLEMTLQGSSLDGTAGNAVDSILRELSEATGGAAPEDDVTLLLLRRSPHVAGGISARVEAPRAIVRDPHASSGVRAPKTESEDVMKVVLG